ncbi:MAG TPA: hypothetical protein VM935_12190 [Chitinophagaceae bacterium]|nr:hypothetical protein [Chitinophagaceae bacterium]
MKNSLLCLALLCSFLSALSQKPRITWGEEFKLRKGSTDLDVICSDKTGVYLQEGHMAMKAYFVIGATVRSSASLIKLDKNLTEQYRNSFDKELKGKEFEQFFVLPGKLFMLSSVNNKKDRTLDIYAAEIDKTTGELTQGWQPISSFQKEEKKDDINFKITYNSDSSKIVVVSSVEGKDKNTYQVQEFDKNLRPGKAVTVSNEFDPKTFQLEDVLYTPEKKIVLVGRIHEYREGKKKKDKFLDFANYNIRVYDEKGKQQSEINTNINSKWLMSTKLVMEKNKDLVLAAFYSKEKRGTIDGMLVQRIDPVSGKVLVTSEKELSTALITGEAEEDNSAGDDDGEESKAERKEREKLEKIRDEGEGFSKHMKFRNIFYTPDNGLVILAEKYHHYTYTTQSYRAGSGTMPGSWTTTTYSVYESGDLMMCKTDASGNISWLQVLPKYQREVIQGGSSSGTGISFSNSFFNVMNMPFYSGFAAIQKDNNINILMNDNAKNADVLRPGQKVKMVSQFRNSNCFVISVDGVTGKYNRNLFFGNKGIPTAMPRLGSIIGNEMYIVGKEDRLLGKTKIAVAKIAVPQK